MTYKSKMLLMAFLCSHEVLNRFGFTPYDQKTCYSTSVLYVVMDFLSCLIRDQLSSRVLINMGGAEAPAAE